MKNSEIVKKQREFFNSGETLSYKFRMDSLKRFENAINDMEKEIEEGLKADLNKSPFESYMCEVGMVLSEISYAKKHLKSWMKNKRVRTTISVAPSSSFIVSEPYGVVLIMSPRNYPFMLCLDPLVGAIAAGNCASIRLPSLSKFTSAVITELIKKTFPEEYITILDSSSEGEEAVLEQRFDYIFFTGSPRVGKLIMQSAAKNLTPVSLELGGKSPCIVDETADIKSAAKRIVFGKFLNSGQTCVAPDYVLVHSSKEKELIEQMIVWLKKMYGDSALDNHDYPKMINEKHFSRVLSLINKKEVVFGGNFNKDTLQIEPTILQGVKRNDAVMEEEIFGPLLPIITYENREDLVNFISSYEHPLALYLFSTSKKNQNWVMEHIQFGGGCINDTIVHLSNPNLPFGGVGGS
jgi:aldehyde dehydrogenase (NAD+)